MMAGHVMPRRLTLLRFEDLPGWAKDDHDAALTVFRITADLLPGSDWAALVREAKDIAPGAARAFLEARLRPVRMEDGVPALFTGYYEPEIDGALAPDAAFRVPLYALPPEAPKGRSWLSRGEIEDGALAGRGLELAWVADPVEAFCKSRAPDGSGFGRAACCGWAMPGRMDRLTRPSGRC